MININNKPWSKLRSTDIQKFLSGTEDENFFFEFKADEETPAKLVKEISAFANTYALRSAYVISYENEKNFFISFKIRRNATRIIEHIITIA